MAYYELEPWGPERHDLTAAMTMAVIANTNRGPDDTAFTAGDFMPDYLRAPEKPEVDVDAIRAKVVLLNELFGGKDKRASS